MESEVRKASSRDGTPIAYTTVGRGPAVLLVGGAMATRHAFGELANRLAPHFTAVAYDRRGRGDSGDTKPYAVAREIEDIDAIINAVAGEKGAAYLYGISSGAVLALEAAAARPARVRKLALYEAPFVVDASHAPLPEDYVAHLQQLIAEGRRGDAVAYFMRAAVGVPEEVIAQIRAQPMWPGLEAVAHTIAYDGYVMGDTMAGKPLPRGAWATATMPTLVMDGGDSEAWMHAATAALVDVLPHARRATLPGQTHIVTEDALAPALIEFFTE